MLDKYEILEQLDMSYLTLQKILNHTKFNDRIGDYFMQMFEETENEDFKRLAERTKNCFSQNYGGVYPNSKVFDIRSINHCNNKFCPNCQKLIQASRLKDMTGQLDRDMQIYDLYHIVFTVPNVSSKDLSYTVTIMFEAFAKLIRYFTGNAKIANLDFEHLGYYAAMRSLEITYNVLRKDYHPHIHCIFALTKGLSFEKDVINKFSYNANNNYALERKFADFEITLQKLWKSIIQNITDRDIERRRVKKAKVDFEYNKRLNPLCGKEIGQSGLIDFIDFGKPKEVQAKRITSDTLLQMSIEDGYSVIMDRVEQDNYYEVFKYAFKLFDDNNTLMQYEQFKTLYKVMNKRKQVQCYGGWYGITLDDNIDTDTNNGLYYLIIQELEKDADRTICCATVQEILEYKKQGYAVISKKQIYKILDLMTADQKAILIADVTPLVLAIKDNMKYARIVKQTMQHFSGIENRYSIPNFGTAKMQRKLQEKRNDYRQFILSEQREDKQQKEFKTFNAMTDEQLKMFVDSIF